MAGASESLMTAEQELDVYPLTKQPRPTPVTVWVRYGAVTLEVQAHGGAWTPKVVAVQWTTLTRAVHRAWGSGLQLLFD